MTLVPPELQARLGVEREHLSGSAGCVHDAVDHDRRGFEQRVVRQLHGPAGLKLADVGRVDLLQRRVVPPLIIAPIGEPILRLGGGVAKAIVGDTAGNVGTEIANGLRSEIRHQALDFRLGESLCEIGGHERFLLDGRARKVPLIESQQFAAGVGEEQRKRIFRAPDSADLLTILGSRDHGARPTAAARIRVGVGIYDFLT